MAEIDLRGQSNADVALDTFCSEASLRSFPLDHAPLAAASLLHLSDGRKVVHVVASHLIFDGWASSVFNAELAVAYQARVAGKVPIQAGRIAFDLWSAGASPDGQRRREGVAAVLAIGAEEPTGPAVTW